MKKKSLDIQWKIVRLNDWGGTITFLSLYLGGT